MSIVILGIDLGKNSCSVVGFDSAGTEVVRGRLRREGVIAFSSRLPPCIVAMEACCGAHHMGRSLAALGHEIRLMPPEYVRPYLKAQKNDDRDAEAIAEAATRPTMRFVELKSEEQFDVRTLRRVRDRLVGERTSLTNQIKSLLLDRRYVVAQGHARLRRPLADLLDVDTGRLSPCMAFLLGDMRTRWDERDRRIAAFDAEFAAIARTDERARRLTSIPGYWCAQRHRIGGRCRQRRDVHERTRSGCVAGSGAQAGNNGRQAEAAWDQETRQSLPAQDADPGGAICHANIGEDEYCGRRLAAGAACAHPSQRRCCRPRREDGPHCLGTSAARPELRSRAADGRLRNMRPPWTWPDATSCEW